MLTARQKEWGDEVQRLARLGTPLSNERMSQAEVDRRAIALLNSYADIFPDDPTED